MYLSYLYTTHSSVLTCGAITILKHYLDWGGCPWTSHVRFPANFKYRMYLAKQSITQVYNIITLNYNVRKVKAYKWYQIFRIYVYYEIQLIWNPSDSNTESPSMSEIIFTNRYERFLPWHKLKLCELRSESFITAASAPQNKISFPNFLVKLVKFPLLLLY